MFDGTQEIIGASTSDATGVRYMNIIEGRSFDPAPIRIVVDSFDSGTGGVSATVTMYSTTEAVNGNFHLILIEDNIGGDNTEVTRLLYTEAISLTGVGNTAVFSTSFTIDPAWNRANLRVIAFVQQADKEIVQAGSSDAPTPYKVRAMVPYSRNAIGPSSGTYTTGDFAVINVGSAETFNVNLVIDQSPVGWTAQYCDAADDCHSTETSLGLTVDGSADYYVKVMPTSPGYMRYHLEVSSALAGTLTVPFAYYSDDIDVLVVDDDGGEAYEDYFTAALETAGLTFGVWDLVEGKTTPEVAAAFPLLVWTTGPGYPDAADRTFLSNYLDQGNSLFITGQDIGWGLADPQSNQDPAFLNEYLHAGYIMDDTNLYDLNGVAGDPVSDGIDLHIAGGTGADNQEYPDEIAAFDSDAVAIFNYVANRVAAVRSVDSTSGAKVVYLGFGFEAIDNAADRAALIKSAVNWLQGRIFMDGFEDASTDSWSAVTP